MIGILAGPLGILLGWTTGTLVGQTTDNTAYDDAVDAIAVLSDRITPGTSTLMVEIDENDPTILDATLADLDARTLRIPIDEVAAEVAELRDQIDEAARTARSARRQSRRAALHDRRTALPTASETSSTSRTSEPMNHPPRADQSPAPPAPGPAGSHRQPSTSSRDSKAGSASPKASPPAAHRSPSHDTHPARRDTRSITRVPYHASTHTCDEGDEESAM